MIIDINLTKNFQLSAVTCHWLPNYIKTSQESRPKAKSETLLHLRSSK